MKDFQYILSIDYSNGGDCEAAGCESEGICRCSTIENASVPLNMRNAEAIAEIFLEAETKKQQREKRIDIILLTYYIQNHWIDDAFDINICGGYYGEEIESVHSKGKWDKNIDAFLSLPIAERIQMAVTPNGIMVHPKLRDIKGCVLLKVKPSELEFTNKRADTKYFKGYLDDEDYRYRNWLVPVCTFKNSKYEVLDGNHRAKTVLEAGKKHIEVICATY